MTTENRDWIQQLVVERKEREYQAESRARLSRAIQAEAPAILESLRRAVARDVARINDEFYGKDVLVLKAGVAGDSDFIVDKITLPAASVFVKIKPYEHTLEYILKTQATHLSHPSKGPTESIEIIAGDDINELRFRKGDKVLSLDAISQRLIEPVVRADQDLTEERR